MDMIRTVSHSVKEEDEDLLRHHGQVAPRSPRTKPTSLLLGVEEVTAPRTSSSSRDDNAVIPAVVDGPHHHRLLSSSSSFLATEEEGASAQGAAANSMQANVEEDRHVVQSGPAEIPCEFGAEDGVVVGSASCVSRQVDEEEDDDDDDNDATEHQQQQQQQADNHNNVEADEEEDEEDYEYEDEDETPFTGFLVDHPQIAASRSDDTDAALATSNDASSSQTHPTKIEDEEAAAAAAASKPKWREPTRAAVNMSLRAEQETSGSKRRLAQDLYRIMNQDTQEAGFSLQPASEDSMDKWTIKLFQFDEDSNLAKDMKVLGLDAIELEMVFPDQYPFEPPFVRVVRPRFKKQTGFVMNGALCMELLTKDGWNPINDIESVIVSVRSLLVVGEGRLEAAANLSETKYAALLAAANETKIKAEANGSAHKRQRKNSAGESFVQQHPPEQQGEQEDDDTNHTGARTSQKQGGSYSVSEAKAAYTHLSDYHKKKGWDNTGWWARKG